MMQKTWKMGTHLSVLSESYPMNTNMGLGGFQKLLHTWDLDESSFSIGRVEKKYIKQIFEMY